MTYDFMRPRTEPARTLYDAFVRESANRDGKSYEEWSAAEDRAVWAAARDYSQQHGLPVLPLDAIVAAGNYASGSADYGSKWAGQVAHMMKARQESLDRS